MVPHPRATLLLAVLAAIFGGVGIYRQTTKLPPAIPDLDSALREVGREHLAIADAPERLRQWLEPLPGDCSVLLFAPGSDWRVNEIYLLASYLAWPRKVWLKVAEENGQSGMQQLPPAPGAPAMRAVLFYQAGPPADIPGQVTVFGPRLVGVTLPAR